MGKTINAMELHGLGKPGAVSAIEEAMATCSGGVGRGRGVGEPRGGTVALAVAVAVAVGVGECAVAVAVAVGVDVWRRRRTARMLGMQYMQAWCQRRFIT